MKQFLIRVLLFGSGIFALITVCSYKSFAMADGPITIGSPWVFYKDQNWFGNTSTDWYILHLFVDIVFALVLAFMTIGAIRILAKRYPIRAKAITAIGIILAVLIAVVVGLYNKSRPLLPVAGEPSRAILVTPDTMVVGAEVTVRGVILENNSKYLTVDGGAHLLIREDSGNVVNVAYLAGEEPCSNSAIGEETSRFKPGTVVEVYGKITTPGFLSICESANHYVKQISPVDAFALSLSVGNSITGITYSINMTTDMLDYSEHPHLQKEPMNTVHHALTPDELSQIQESIRTTRLLTMSSTQELVPDAGTYRLAITQDGKSKQLVCLMPLPDRSDSPCTKSFIRLVEIINKVLNVDIK